MPPREKKPEPLRVVICDDHHAQAELMRIWLEEYDGDCRYEVIGTPHTRALAVMMCEEHQPDVLIMDYSMPGECIAVEQLRDLIPDTPIILWTGYDRQDLPPEVVLSVTGVLVKTLDPEHACIAINTALGTGEPKRWPGTGV